MSTRATRLIVLSRASAVVTNASNKCSLKQLLPELGEKWVTFDERFAHAQPKIPIISYVGKSWLTEAEALERYRRQQQHEMIDER